MDTSPGANNLPEDEELEDDWVNDQQSLEDKRCGWCKEINAKKHLIICNTCHIPYHKTCVKVTRAQAKVFKNYKCPPCRNINNITPNTGNQSPSPFDLLHHLQTCKSNISLIGNIPRGARITAAEALNTLINDVIQFNNSISWSKLLCFAFHCLQKPKKEKSSANSPSLTTKIKNQISLFMSSVFPPTEFPFELRKRNHKPKTKEEILKNRVNTKFAENDLRGAIRELSSDDTLAPDNNETLQQLKERHPAAPVSFSPPQAPENEENHIPASNEAVKLAILTFPAGSAGGPDGLKPGHLKHLIGAAEAGNRLLESLTKLVNLVLKNMIPEDIRPIFLVQTFVH